MNKYEQQAAQQRRASLRSSMNMWTAGAALVVVVLLILGLSNSAPSNFMPRAAIGAAVFLLVLRLISRRLRNQGPKAAQPDPRSKLNLD